MKVRANVRKGLTVLRASGLPLSALALLAPVSLLVTHEPVEAQQAQPDNAKVCMARAESLSGSGEFSIVVPASEQAAMEGAGYSVRPCQDNAEALAAYRAWACHLANDAPLNVQNRITERHGVSPRRLCDMVNAISQ